MSLLVALPLLIPLLAASLATVAWRSVRTQRVVGIGSSLALLGAAIALLVAVADGSIHRVHVGGWAPPFGIVLVADVLGAVMVLVSAVIALAVIVYAFAGGIARRSGAIFVPLYNVLMLGVCGAFLTGDLFNLYVWFEVMLIGSFVLLSMGGRRRHFRAGLRYVMLNLLSSALFLAGVGLVYGLTGTLNFADLHVRLGLLGSDAAALVPAATLLALGFGIKAGVFPLFFWLPASYPAAAAPVAAIFAGLLTKVGVYALLRVFGQVFPPGTLDPGAVLLVAGLTMIVGVLGAVAQQDIRRILSFHIISQIGYMVVALGLVGAADPAVRALGLAATIFYLVHHIIVKANLFLLGGVIRRSGGSYRLPVIGGLLKSTPVLAVLFLIPALSLAGIPPLSGFWAKLAVIRAGLEGEAYLVVAAALAAGLLTMVSMMKIWNEAFWKAAPEERQTGRRLASHRRHWRLIPIGALAAITLALGLFPGPLFELSRRAALQLLDPAGYVEAVGLGTVPREAPASVQGDSP